MKYQLRDLLEDKTFVNWVQEADGAASTKWHLYFQQHSRQRPLLEEATFIVRGIQFTPQRLEPQFVEKQWQQLQGRLAMPPDVCKQPAPSFWQNSRYLAGLFGGLLLGVIGYWYFKTD